MKKNNREKFFSEREYMPDKKDGKNETLKTIFGGEFLSSYGKSTTTHVMCTAKSESEWQRCISSP